MRLVVPSKRTNIAIIHPETTFETVALNEVFKARQGIFKALSPDGDASGGLEISAYDIVAALAIAAGATK